ncbi:MAG: HAMP domain-containing histidine kinase [Eubacterium sp.]|nr:HAMP domain-containing histidine kinase [Eubacterium sp.]
MKKKIVYISLIYILILAAFAFAIMMVLFSSNKEVEQLRNDRVVAENELQQLILFGDTDGALDAVDNISSKDEEITYAIIQKEVLCVWAMMLFCIIMILSLLVFIYVRILRPFDELKEYATEISKGNLDVSLKMGKGNYFGDFTWAFDNMRKEIIKSRTAEKNAIENNKTVIATLSHDIKTPMASIRAYAEAFEANMDSTPEKRQKYLTILMEKCDEVSKLTNDLFIHSISEMNKLDVNKESFDIIEFLDKDVRGLFVSEDEVDIIFPESDDESKAILVNADKKRLLQIIENLKSNSEKYAKTKVEISLENTDGVKLHFRDFGPGIPDEEMPFITGKFYRGKNVGDENGSGLGLYIVDELVGRMDGSLKLYNRDPGLEVVIDLKETDE